MHRLSPHACVDRALVVVVFRIFDVVEWDDGAITTEEDLAVTVLLDLRGSLDVVERLSSA